MPRARPLLKTPSMLHRHHQTPRLPRVLRRLLTTMFHSNPSTPKMSKQILSPHGSVVSVAQIDTSAICAAVWEVSVGANWYCYTATEQRANHLRQLLSDHPEGAYPLPRNAITDPPKQSDANSSGEVLGIAEGNGITDWTTWPWHQRGMTLRLWMPLPPPIPEQKSEAALAWEESSIRTQAEKFTSQELFEAGFRHGAAKKGGGA